jgi:hypothetical protein
MHGASAEWTWRDLIRLADIAAYSVKSEGGDGWAGFPPANESFRIPSDWAVSQVSEWIAAGHLVRESSRMRKEPAIA